MSIRVAVWTVALVFGLSLLGAIGLFVFERSVPLRALLGSHTLHVENDLYRHVLSRTDVFVTINQDNTFQVEHPLGQALGTVRMADQLLIFEFASVDGKSLPAWQAEWPRCQLDLVRRATWLAHGGLRSGKNVWNELARAKNAEEGLQRILKKDGHLIDDPFARPWQFKLQSTRRWVASEPAQPEKW